MLSVGAQMGPLRGGRFGNIANTGTHYDPKEGHATVTCIAGHEDAAHQALADVLVTASAPIRHVTVRVGDVAEHVRDMKWARFRFIEVFRRMRGNVTQERLGRALQSITAIRGEERVMIFLVAPMLGLRRLEVQSLEARILRGICPNLENLILCDVVFWDDIRLLDSLGAPERTRIRLRRCVVRPAIAWRSRGPGVNPVRELMARRVSFGSDKEREGNEVVLVHAGRGHSSRLVLSDDTAARVADAVDEYVRARLVAPQF